jgi:hypothetical protein
VIRIGAYTYAGAYTNDTIKIMSHGRPNSATFGLVITSPALVARGQEVDVVISFKGEKSPSKISRYKY